MFNMQQYPQTGAVTAAAFELIDQLEEQMSVYRSESEVSKLNRTANKTPTKVESKLFQLLQLAAELHTRTGGAFDITSTPLTQVWGFDQRDARIPNQDSIDTALSKVGGDQIVLDPISQTVLFVDKEIGINLGGIGKGHALDRIADFMSENAISDFLIHGGQSSVVGRGSQVVSKDESTPTSGWVVGLSHPLIPEHRLAEITIMNEALGTSGTGRQGFFFQGKRYGHIIDPRTGWPSDHFLSTTVISPSAALSDALATAFFVMSIEEVEEYCRANQQVKAILVTQGKSQGQTDIEWFNLADEEWRRI